MKTFEKDPEAVLDYKWDWTEWLGEDTIQTVLITVEAGDIVIEEEISDSKTVTVWLSGGTINEPTIVTCRVTTAEGRTDERSARFYVKDR